MFKKVISLLLAITLVSGTTIGVFADSVSKSPSVNTDSKKIIDPNNYDIHKITYPKSEKVIEDSNLDKKK